MVRNRRNKILVCLLLVMSCLFLASSAFVVQAEDEPTLTNKQIIEQLSGKSDLVADTKVFGDNSGTIFKHLFGIALEKPDEYVEVVKAVVDVAEKRSDAYKLIETGDIDEANAADDIEFGSFNEAKKHAENFLKNSVLDKTDVNPAIYSAKYDNVLQKYLDFQTELEKIRQTDKEEFETQRLKAAEDIGAEYKKLILTTDASDRKGNQKVGAYSAEQLVKLNDVLAKYVEYVDEAYKPAEDGELAKVEYSAKEIKAKYAELENVKNIGIEELGRIKKNVFELVYSEYMAYLAANDKYQAAEDTTEKEELGAKRDELLGALKGNNYARVNEALSFYNGAADEVKTKYSAEKTNLEHFIQENPPLVLAELVSSITDKYGVATITAYFDESTPSEAKVFSKTSDGGRLELFANANGAKKRIANELIKVDNKLFSIAYLINFRVYKSEYGQLELPETAFKYNEDGTKRTYPNGKFVTGNVYYRVELDLNKYFEKYCQARGYESDKLSNVENAFSACNDGNSALCYVYKGDKIEKTYVPGSKQTELEGGKLVFYTKGFNDICVAGTGLENLLTNPWFWVLALVALILLIIIVKIVIKNFKYSIKFVSNGGTAVRSIRVAKGEAIILPEAPTKTGLVFAGWFIDEACTVRFIETKLRRRKGYKLYAKWAAPVSAELLTSFYDGLRTFMVSYEKCSFKPTLGMVERELIANMFGEENYVVLYLALKADKAKELPGGESASSHKDKKFAALPTKVIISDAKSYADAIKLTEQTMIAKGLQMKEVAPEKVTSTPEERAAGFAYYVKNERVAASMADYFELLRIGLKSYVLETDNGKFKPGDRFTFARIYYTAKNVDLYMPVTKGIKELEKGEREPRFSDTPVHIVICDNGDMEKAFDVIEKAMLSYGFTKYPENSNDLEDVVLSDTDGFAYTIRF